MIERTRDATDSVVGAASTPHLVSRAPLPLSEAGASLTGMAAAPEFVHLHVHSDYSILDGACKIARLLDRVEGMGQTATALTDHGVMSGAIELYRTEARHHADRRARGLPRAGPPRTPGA